MVDGDTIQKIKDEYQNSDQERADLIAAFEHFEGNMDAVFEEMMCSNVLDDDERFRTIINDAISKGDATAWKKYKREPASKKRKRAKRAQKEATEARAYAEELGITDKLFGREKACGKKKDDTEPETPRRCFHRGPRSKIWSGQEIGERKEATDLRRATGRGIYQKQEESSSIRREVRNQI
jgi:hypothetical protein